MERMAGASLLSEIRIAFQVTPPPPVPACGSSRSLTDLVHHCASANDFELLIVVSEYSHAHAVLCSMTLITYTQTRTAPARAARGEAHPVNNNFCIAAGGHVGIGTRSTTLLFSSFESAVYVTETSKLIFRAVHTLNVDVLRRCRGGRSPGKLRT